MAEDKVKTLGEKTQGFLSISKLVEEWAAMLPDPKAMQQFKDGRKLLEEAWFNLDFMLKVIDTTQDLEPSDQLSEHSPDESPKQSSAKSPDESSVKFLIKSNLSCDAPPWNPPEEPSSEMPKESAEELPPKLVVKLPIKSNLSCDAPPWYPRVQGVSESNPVFFHPEYSPSLEHPTPAVPIFYGDPRYWTVFKESFEQVVHSNPDLSRNEKVGYLVGYLDGEAKSLVASIPPVDENYDLIWNTLEAKYTDPSTTVVRYDFSPRALTSSSHVEGFYYLQEVLHYCFLVYKTLSRMHSESLGDYVVYTIAQSKLDTDMLNQFMKSLNQDQIPTFDQTSGFLQHHIQRMGRTSKDLTKMKFKNLKLGRLPGLFTTTPDAKLCQFCRQSTHKLFNCPGFLALTPDNRYAFIKTNNRCFNCLGERHSVSMCLSDNVCFFCKSKHHTLLHDEEINPDGHYHLKVFNNDGVGGSTFTIPVYVFNEQTIILATAVVSAFSNTGNYVVSARALLDSGSQCHLISNRCRISLNLPLLPLHPALSGVGEVRGGILGASVVKFASRFNHNQAWSVIAYVIDHICYDLPSAQIDPRMKEDLSKFKLADPNFDTPSSIDMLIGSEVYPMLLKKGQYRVPHSFCYSMETAFGWIVMGSAPYQFPINPRYSMSCCMNALKHTLRRLNDLDEFFHPEKFPELMQQLV